MRVGIAGLGKMGSIFADRIKAAGHELAVWNRTSEKAKAVAGAMVAASPADLASRCEIVLTIVSDDAAVTEVYQGAGGLLSGDIAGRLFIEMSTVRPATHVRIGQAVAAAGGRIIECPVGGSVKVASEGKLLGFAGGEAADLDRARPVLEALCRRIDHAGPVGAGAALKLAINLPLLVYWQALGEAVSLTDGYGFDPNWLIELLSESSRGAMARNLTKAGWEVVGFDIVAERRSEAEAAGIAGADSAASVAARAPTIIMSLPSAGAAHAVARELAGAQERRVVVETSTLSLEDKEEIRRVLEAAGHVALDAPLSGTGAQAQTADLVVFASGDSATIASLMPMFAGFSREAHDLGAFGNGSRMKFVANLLVAINNVASAEALVLAEKAGLDLRQVVKLVGAGAAQSRIFDLRAPMMADNHYLPATMRLSTWQKDMAVIGAFASALGSPAPLFRATIPIYDAANGMDLGDLDVAAVLSVFETMSGVRRT